MSHREQHDEHLYWPSPSGANNVLVGSKFDVVKDGSNWSAGQLKSTPHPYSMTLQSAQIGYYKWYNASNPDYFGWSHHTFNETSPDFSANDQIKLITSLKDHWHGGSFSAGNAIGELASTVNGLASLLHDFRRALRGDLSVLNFLNKKEKKIGDRWLEFQFGIRPLIGDIYDAAQVISKFAYRKRRIRVVRKGRPGTVSGTGDCTASGSSFRSRSIVAYFEQEANLVEALGLDNPAGVLWEVMPWSFAVDWVLPIGDFIAAQTFALQTKGTFVTTDFYHRHVDASLIESGPSATVPGYVVQDFGRTSYTSVSVSRTVSTELSVPLPEIKSSLLGGKPLERLTTALSLVSQMWKK